MVCPIPQGDHNETVVSYTITNQTFVITSYITAVVYNKDTDMYTQALMIRKSGKGIRPTNTDRQ